MIKHAMARLVTVRRQRAFSLVEVVLAIAVVSFCLFALLGLMSVGAQASYDSSETVQAATMASLIISERRAAPTNTISPTFPVFPLTNTMSPASSYVAADGTSLSTSQTNLPVYRLAYKVTSNANKTASLYFCLSWPPSIDPTINPGAVKGRYEVFTCIPLP